MKTKTLLAPILTAALLAAAPLHAENSAADLFPEKLINAKGEEVSRDELKDKIVGIYFSAHWCPPCRTFTPSLVEFHGKNAGKEFEIVFVSFDNSEQEKADYIKHDKMKWLTLKGNRSDEGGALAQKFGVRGIPALVILAPDGSTITTNGRADVSGDPEGALKKWKAAVASN